MKRLTGRLVLMGATLAGGLGLAACGSSSHPVGVGTTTMVTTASTVPVTTPTSVHMPTVSECGGGAYKPTTLLIGCSGGTTTVTGISWTSWSSSAASGTGTVHLQVGGKPVQAAAHLTLGTVVSGSVGPQFTRLTVSWIGTSPDGHSQDSYSLSSPT